MQRPRRVSRHGSGDPSADPGILKKRNYTTEFMEELGLFSFFYLTTEESLSVLGR